METKTDLRKVATGVSGSETSHHTLAAVPVGDELESSAEVDETRTKLPDEERERSERGPSRSTLVLGLFLGLAICVPWAFSVSGPPPDPVEAPVGPDSLELIDGALARIEAGAWSEARAHLNQARKLEPEAEEIGRFLTRIGEEEEASKRLAEAQRCKAEGDAPCVAIALAGVDIDGLAYALEAGAELQAWLDDLEDSAGSNDVVEGGGESSPGLPLAEEPHQGAPEAIVRAPKSRGGRPAVDQRGIASQRRRGARQVAAASLGAAAFDEAAEALRDAGEGALAARIERCRSALDEGSGRATLGELEDAHSLLQELDVSGPIPLRVGKRMAEESVGIGMIAKQRGNWTEAYRLFVQARTVDPDSRLARQELEEIRTRAHALLIEGYGLRTRRPEEAREKLQAVLALSAPSDDVYQKAQKWIASIDGAS